MRRSLSLSLALACCACAPAAPAPIQAPAVVHTPVPPSAPGSAAAPAPEPVPAGRRPAFVGAVDGALADRFLVTLLAALDPSIRQAMERELGFNSGALAQSSLLAVLGLDATRPMLFGLASLDERARALMDEARRAAPSQEGSDKSSVRDRVVSKLVRERDGTEVHFSCVIPTVDWQSSKELLEQVLDRAGWKRSPEPQGFESVWTDRDQLLAIGRAGDSLAIDVAQLGQRGDRAITLLHGRSMSLRESLRAAAPPTEGSTARVTYSPARVAEVGFFHAMASVQRAVRNLDQEYRDRVLREGLLEASRILDLAGSADGGYFESVDVSLQTQGLLPGITGVAAAGPGTLVPSGAACSPTVSLDFPDSDVTYDGTNACLRSFRLPGDPANGAIEQSRHRDWLRDGGAWGRFVALPFILPSIARERLSYLQGLGPGALQKFERFGWTAPHDSKLGSLFWGMLPSGTAQGQAACAVTGQAAPCTGALAAGRARQVERAWARLMRVGDRWVVLLSSDRASVEKASPALTGGAVPGIRIEVEARALHRDLPPSILTVPLEAWKWGGSARWEGDKLRVSMQPAQRKP